MLGSVEGCEVDSRKGEGTQRRDKKGIRSGPHRELGWPTTADTRRPQWPLHPNSQTGLSSDSSVQMGPCQCKLSEVWSWGERKTARRKEEVAQNAAPQQDQAGHILDPPAAVLTRGHCGSVEAGI